MKKTTIHIACSSWMALGLGLTVQGQDTIDFSKQVKPILEANCLSCHNPENVKGELLMDTRENVIIGGEYGSALEPGKPDESSLYTLTILDPDDEDIMPPKGDPLMKDQTDILKVWIEQGAEWPEDAVLKPARKVDFVEDVQLVLEQNCVFHNLNFHFQHQIRVL